MLLTTKTVLQQPNGLEAMEFFLAHALLDISGVQGHVTLEGSPVLTEDLCASFLLARDAVLQQRVMIHSLFPPPPLVSVSYVDYRTREFSQQMRTTTI